MAENLFSQEQITAALEVLSPGDREQVMAQLATQQEAADLQQTQDKMFENALPVADYFYRYEHAMHAHTGQVDTIRHGWQVAAAIQEHPALNNPAYQATIEATAILYAFSFAWEDAVEDRFTMERYAHTPLVVSGIADADIVAAIQTGFREWDRLDPEYELSDELRQSVDNLTTAEGMYGFSQGLATRYAFRPYSQAMTEQFEALGISFPLNAEDDIEDYGTSYDPDLCGAYPDYGVAFVDGEFQGGPLAGD